MSPPIQRHAQVSGLGESTRRRGFSTVASSSCTASFPSPSQSPFSFVLSRQLRRRPTGSESTLCLHDKERGGAIRRPRKREAPHKTARMRYPVASGSSHLPAEAPAAAAMGVGRSPPPDPVHWRRPSRRSCAHYATHTLSESSRVHRAIETFSIPC